MKVETIIHKGVGSEPVRRSELKDAQLVLYFISPTYGPKEAFFNSLRSSYPDAEIVGCLTGGEIFTDAMSNGSAVAAAIKFGSTSIRTALANVKFFAPSYDLGSELAEQLEDEKLRHIFVLADGLLVNGTDLVRGMSDHLPPDVTITGGLSGDDSNFKQTGVGHNSLPFSGAIVAIGFYGEKFQACFGSLAGWDTPVGTHTITRSSGCILYELDGRPALDVYAEIMGKDFEQLPGSGLLYPLTIRPDATSNQILTRTIIGIDREQKSLIYAGDIPQGYEAKLMRGNQQELLNGARSAGEQCREDKNDAPQTQDCLAILISCIGRHLVLKERTSEEVRAVRDVLGNPPTIGFYSYGEICPHHTTGTCSLHNQTMTVTVMSEKA